MHAQKKALTDLQCKDNFRIQCVLTSPKTTIKDIINMFKKNSRYTFKKRFSILYTSQSQPPSVAQERSNEGDLLTIQPQELQFPFELNKQTSCNMQLTNKTDCNVAFKVYTTNPKKYCVLPNYGIVLPRSTHNVIVEMEAQKEAPANMECNDKFLIQSMKTSKDIDSDIESDMFNKESGHVGEYTLNVSYVSPPQPTLAAQERSDEGVSVSDNGNLRSDSIRNSAIPKFSYVSPPPPSAPQERSAEAVSVLDDGNSSPDLTKILGILQASDVSPPQPPSNAQKRPYESSSIPNNGNLSSDTIMNPVSGELLSVQPQELQINFKLNREMFCSMKLTNNTDSYVAFKVKSTNATKYCVRPNIGIVMPLSTRYLLAMIQAQLEAPSNMECKDMFLISSVISSAETTMEDTMFDMFNNETGNVVYEQRLKVHYIVSPSQTLVAALHIQDGFGFNSRSDDVKPEDNSIKLLKSLMLLGACRNL